MASIQYVVSATDAASAVFAKIGLSADGLDRQLEELGKRIADPEVTLDDSKFTLGMIRAAQRLDKLSARVADPKVTVDTGQAQVEILRINAMLDRLDAKRVSVTVGAARLGLLGRAGQALGSWGALGQLFGLGTSAAGAGAPAAGAGGTTGLAAVGRLAATPGGAAGAAVLAPSAVALIDAVLGQGLGTGVAGAGAGLVAAFNPAVLAPGLRNIKTTLSSVAQSIGPSLGMMLAQFGKFVQGFAPELAKLFSSSLPFMKQFFTLMEIGARTILPAVTLVLKQMVASGALKAMTQGLVFLIQAIASLIVHIGPGLKAGALAFRAIMIGLRDAVYIFADAWGFLGKVAGKEYSFLRSAWDDFRHWFASSFDAWRHQWAALWFQAWDTAVKIWHNIVSSASAAWDLLVKAAKTGIVTVISLFTGLPDRVLRALWGLGHSLYAFGHAAFTELLNGLKSVGGSIISWAGSFIKSLPGKFLHWLGMSPPHPGSAFYDLGANMMHHLEAGMKSRAQNIGIGAITGALRGGTGVQRWAPEVLQALRMLGQPSGDLGVVLAQMQTESGGNPVVVNKWDSNWAAGTPSVGLMQVIGPTFDAYAGPFRSVGPFEYGTSVNPLANIYAGLNYAIHRYGPAWTRVLGQGHGYDQGGWLPPGVTLAVNRTGVPERVLPPGAATGNTYITVQVGHGTHPVAAAQEIVKLLNAGAKSGVKLRTSILGPG
jgi:hypothetical protein